MRLQYISRELVRAQLARGGPNFAGGERRELRPLFVINRIQSELDPRAPSEAEAADVRLPVAFKQIRMESAIPRLGPKWIGRSSVIPEEQMVAHHWRVSVSRKVSICCSAVAIVLLVSAKTLADNDDRRAHYSAVPEVSVFEAGDPNGCGTGSPAGSNIVTSAWLRGMGLPDNGGANTTQLDFATNPNKRDPHTGLLLSKNGPTPDCSSAEARIEGWKKGTISELGFDYRNGGHCGAGAPRFNVTVRTSNGHTQTTQTFFFGCLYGVHTPAPQDPLQWTRVRFGAAACAPTTGAPDPCQIAGFVFAPPPGTKGDQSPTPMSVERIDIVYDEGTDALSLEDPNGVGLAVLDNIDINGVLITTGTGVCPGTGKDGDSCPSARGRDNEEKRDRDRN